MFGFEYMAAVLRFDILSSEIFNFVINSFVKLSSLSAFLPIFFDFSILTKIL